ELDPVAPDSAEGNVARAGIEEEIAVGVGDVYLAGAGVEGKRSAGSPAGDLRRSDVEQEVSIHVGDGYGAHREVERYRPAGRNPHAQVRRRVEPGSIAVDADPPPPVSPVIIEERPVIADPDLGSRTPAERRVDDLVPRIDDPERLPPAERSGFDPEACGIGTARRHLRGDCGAGAGFQA